MAISKQSSNLRVSQEVHNWLDEYRNGIPKVKFLNMILKQLEITYTPDGKICPRIKKGEK